MANRLLIFILCLIHKTFTEGSGDNFSTDDLAAMFDFSTDGSGTNKGQDNILDGSYPSSKVLCYRCGEDGGNTCDLDDLKTQPQHYIKDCHGHCLNISSDKFTVYTCADEPHGGKSSCISNGVMNMCACTADLCNGPVGVLSIKQNKRQNSLNSAEGADKKSIRFVFVFFHIVLPLLLVVV